MRVELVVTGGLRRTGGVTTHVKDIVSLLAAEGDTSRVLSPEQMLFKFRWLSGRLSRRDPVHFHTSCPTGFRLATLMLIIYLSDADRAILTLHHGNAPHVYAHRPVSRWLLRRLLGRVRCVVALDWQMFGYLESLGAEWMEKSGSFVQLPPQEVTISEGISPCDSWNAEFDGPWVATSGYESQLYGFEQLVMALSRIPIPAGLKCYTYGPRNLGFIEGILSLARELDVSFVWYRSLTYPEFLSSIRESDVYCRNTSSDTFGLAIVDAMSQGLRVVATDVCDRPTGTVLVTPGDRSALESALMEVIAKDDSPVMMNDLKELARANGAIILDAYRSLSAELTRAE